MARILILTPQLPYPPHQGTTIRNFNLIAGLAHRHTLDLATFLAPGQVSAPASPGRRRGEPAGRFVPVQGARLASERLLPPDRRRTGARPHPDPACV